MDVFDLTFPLLANHANDDDHCCNSKIMRKGLPI